MSIAGNFSKLILPNLELVLKIPLRAFLTSLPAKLYTAIYTLVLVSICLDPLMAQPPGLPNLSLPNGFVSEIYADKIAPGTRHIVVRDNGDLYARVEGADGGTWGLRDNDKDGRADQTIKFGRGGGTGIAIFGGYLYYSTDSEVFRQKLRDTELAPDEKIESVINGLFNRSQHAAKSISINSRGDLFVNIGAPSNACQQDDRTPRSPGLKPCPLLETSGGIWQFSATKLNQSFPKDGKRYATGIRNAVAISWNEEVDELFLVQHGRDQLSSFFPESFTDLQNAELPAEEFHLVKEGANAGWPYTYFDQLVGHRMLAPEYGGDGKKLSQDPAFQDPIIGFPGHWAPNGLTFYRSGNFPARFNGGAFIAFHGSWNRAPRPQAGYLVAFVPYLHGTFVSHYEIFANGFMGRDSIASPAEARARPMGLAVDKNGSLFISDSKQGVVWRIKYAG